MPRNWYILLIVMCLVVFSNAINIAYRELRTYTFPNVLVMLKMQNKSFDRLLHKIPLFFFSSYGSSYFFTFLYISSYNLSLQNVYIRSYLTIT